MKNFISFMAKFIAIVAVLAAAAYWINYFLKATGKLELCIKSMEKLLSKKNVTTESIEPTETIPQNTCSCNDAVCAVDMCMPY